MIIWLNGPFGGGKTTTAAQLRSLLPGSRLFDPETVGYMLMSNLADLPVSDFQHWPPWRPLVVATADALARFTGANLIAPQTLLAARYLDEICAGLHTAGHDVFHVMLDCRAEVLRSRIMASEEARQWRLDHLDSYITARSWLIPAADLVVDTSDRTPAEVAGQIRAALPAPWPAAPEVAAEPALPA